MTLPILHPELVRLIHGHWAAEQMAARGRELAERRRHRIAA